MARDISNDPQLDVKFHESFHTLSASDVNPCTNWSIGKKVSLSIDFPYNIGAYTLKIQFSQGNWGIRK